MNKELVTTAYQLYVDTFDLESMEYDDPRFHDLYSKECQLFDLMRKFTPEESTLYVQLICEWNATREVHKEKEYEG